VKRLTLLFVSCATINPAGMSDSCKRHETQAAAKAVRNARYDRLTRCVLHCETAARRYH
jgi:hypothetical protein